MSSTLQIDEVSHCRTRYWWFPVGLVAVTGLVPTGYGVVALGLATENAKGDPMPMAIRVGSFVALAAVVLLVAAMARASFSVGPQGIAVRLSLIHI